MNEYSISCNGRDCGIVIAQSYARALELAMQKIEEAKIWQLAVERRPTN